MSKSTLLKNARNYAEYLRKKERRNSDAILVIKKTLDILQGFLI